MASFKSPYSFSTSPIFSINTSSNASSPWPSTSLSYSKSNSPPITLTFATSTATSATTTSNSFRSTRFTGRSSLYEVLGLQIGADTVEIKAAYRRLARVLHPDVGNLDSSADEFIRVHSAYATLSDPGKRADYDRSLFAREELAVRSCSAAGYGGRRWETDQCW